MKIRSEKWDESILGIDHYRAERALANAGLDAIRRARRFGTDFVVQEGGRAKSLRPEETAPYEKRFLEDVERLSRKIAELEAQNPGAFALNDRPKGQEPGGKA
ncbi:MAG: hypothetical protein C5B50_02580 [Verrucomicrobia bacterium]|nr:MAG: hypothetical protein C5B50_02580 [Verrucomicrobiota bacterium]